MKKEQAVSGILLLAGAFILPELVIEQFLDLHVSAMGYDLTPYAKWGLTILMSMIGGSNLLKGLFGKSETTGGTGGLLGGLGGLLGRFA